MPGTPAPAPPASRVDRSQPRWVAGRQPDGSREIVFDGVRFVVSAAGRVSIAPVRFPTNIVASVQVDGGWVFVTSGGDVARADTFLGTPRPLGLLRCDFHTDRAAVGRVALIDADGTLWTTDGTAPPTRASLDRPARAAIFANARWGAVVLAEGQVLLTADGAQTWSPFGLAGDIAWDAFQGTLGPTLQTTAGSLLLASGVPQHRPEARRIDPASTAVDEALAARLVDASTEATAMYQQATAIDGCTARFNDRPPLAAVAPAALECTAPATRAGPRGVAGPLVVRTAPSTSGAASWRAIARTPQGTLVGAEGRRAPRLGWIAGHGPVVAIADPFFDEIDDPATPMTLALPDGGLGVMLTRAARPLDLGVTIDVGPDGAVRGRRAYFVRRDRPRPTALARRGQCVGQVIGTSLSGHFLPVTRPAFGCDQEEEVVGLDTLIDGARTPCGEGAPSADALVTVIDEGTRSFRREGAAEATAMQRVVHVEMSNACFYAVDTFALFDDDPLPWHLRLTPGEGQTLVANPRGDDFDPGAPVSCRPMR